MLACDGFSLEDLNTNLASNSNYITVLGFDMFACDGFGL